MALEDLTGPNKYISNLVPTNPTTTDPISQGDNHLQGIKNVLLNTFPGSAGSAPQIIGNVVQSRYFFQTGASTSSVTYVAIGGPVIFTPKLAASSILLEVDLLADLACSVGSASAEWGMFESAVQIAGVQCQLSWTDAALTRLTCKQRLFWNYINASLSQKSFQLFAKVGVTNMLLQTLYPQFKISELAP